MTNKINSISTPGPATSTASSGNISQPRSGEVGQIFSNNSTEHPIRSDGNGISKKRKQKPKADFSGKAFPSEYNSWKNAKQRCRNPKAEDARYKGIVFSKKFDHFADFMRHIGPKTSSAYTLDRIDNNRGYVPGNVRWASKSAQAQNRKSTILVEHAGESKPLKDWAAVFGLPLATLYARYHRGDRDPSFLFRKHAKATQSSKEGHKQASNCRSGVRDDKSSNRTKVLTSSDSDVYLDSLDDGMVLAKNPDTNRKRFFRRAARIEREAEQERAEHARIEEKRLAELAREEKEKKRLLTIQSSSEARAWREANGVSHAEAERYQAERKRNYEADLREDALSRINVFFNKPEGRLSKELGEVDLRGLIKVVAREIPEIRRHIPPILQEYLSMPRKERRNNSTSTLALAELAPDRQSSGRGNEAPPEYASIQHYEDHLDAAIGLGHVPDNDGDDDPS